MTYNSLIIRVLFTRPHVSPNNIGLHKGWTHIRPATSGFASCGRAFCMLLLGFMLFVGTGCTNESLQSTGEMERLYAESTTLPTVAADSIQRFAYKLETYAQKNPQAQADPLWPEII